MFGSRVKKNVFQPSKMLKYHSMANPQAGKVYTEITNEPFQLKISKFVQTQSIYLTIKTFIHFF